MVETEYDDTEKETTTSNLQRDPSDEVDTDEVSDDDSTASLFSDYIRGPYLEIEEINEGLIQFSRTLPLTILTNLYSVTGHYLMDRDSSGVSSLTFHSNVRKYGTFGNEEGRLPEVSGCKIVGFHGRVSEERLNAIGFHIVPSESPLFPVCDALNDVLQESGLMP